MVSIATEGTNAGTCLRGMGPNDWDQLRYHPIKRWLRGKAMTFFFAHGKNCFGIYHGGGDGLWNVRWLLEDIPERIGCAILVWAKVSM